ncbi:MAG TPA: hypothetical protein VHI31_03815 [Actinomycetota bacterium]|nr:hypothetical protein [Actinomycetota bacterium]
MISEIELEQGRPSAITVQTDDGPERILIDRDRDYGFDLGHLEEHRTQKLPVLVEVEDADGRTVASKIEDA